MNATTSAPPSLPLVEENDEESFGHSALAHAPVACSTSAPDGVPHPQTNHTVTPHVQTLYVPIESPPTPAPSPGPLSNRPPTYPLGVASHHFLSSQDPILRRQILTSILTSCSPSELLFISTTVAPLLKRDFLFWLPIELSLHILSFIDDPKSLVHASMVSKHWHKLITEEAVWRAMCRKHGFEDFDSDYSGLHRDRFSPAVWKERFSYRDHFKASHITMTNWRTGGSLLQSHRLPVVNPDTGVVTSLALDKEWIVVGLANSKIHIFSAKTGILARTLVGHEIGVWAVCLVSKGGYRVRPPQDDVTSGKRANATEPLRVGMDRLNIGQTQEQYVSPSLRTALGLDLNDDDCDPCEAGEHDSRQHTEVFPGKRSDNSFASQGWGQPNALVVSGACDKVLRVWDIKTGYCIYILSGHTATIRCLRVLHNRPIAVSGSRDGTVRVWDIQRGRVLRVLLGHRHSVRCLDVCGNRIVSGSYDTTCRVWDVDTGECLHILRGHYHEIYSVAFDGVRIASGGLDTTVRVWDAQTGDCVALLQGHTALVCQVQLSPNILATGGSDGRVITFDLSKYTVLHRIAAHDSSVTSLQFDQNFLVTGGNDGRTRLYDTTTGSYIRDLTDPSETVWKFAYLKDICAIMCRRAGRTIVEIWNMRPKNL
ncbi:F-box/WD repeat-containing protein 7 [Leucoagaricus sp. SymC.cos]|nr:F-box/WD repeat-containing protein 7 [Leucoagaricus sp. SymC.cos]